MPHDNAACLVFSDGLVLPHVQTVSDGSATCQYAVFIGYRIRRVG